MSYRCTVIGVMPDSDDRPIYQGPCENAGTVEIDTEDIEEANKKLSFPWYEEIVGNYICDMHAERVGDI